MRKRNGDREGTARHVMDGELADSNEQELQKIGIGGADPLTKKKNRQKARKKVLLERSLTAVGEESSENCLPARWEDSRAVKAGRDTSKDAEGRNSAYHETTAKPSPKKAGKREGASRWAMALMALFVLLALGVLAGAYAYSQRWGKEASPPAETPTGGETEQPSRVIFVREDGTESGMLSAPELYAACADTAVSILTESEGRTGVGSGFFLRSDGYIGTSYHVIEGSEALTAVLSDGRRYEATPVAGNALCDLALLKIEGEGFCAVTPGSSSELLVGERVYAIGTPASLDYAGSISSGEVSYLGRTVRLGEDSEAGEEKKMTLIQTTAPVNRGNSGCPLFDGYGKLVGIVTMRLGDSFAGVGFAIPADGALPILQAMMEGRDVDEALLSSVAVRAPKLGVQGEADSEGGVFGVRIVGFSQGVTDPQGLKEGDLILLIDGVAVCVASDIRLALREKDPGESVSVTVLRGAQSLTFEVILRD